MEQHLLTILGVVAFLGIIAIARFWFDRAVREAGARPILVCMLVIAFGALIASLLQRFMIGVIAGLAIAVIGYLSLFPILIQGVCRLRYTQDTPDAPEAR